MKVEMNEFVTLENRGGQLTVDREGVERLLGALRKKEEEIRAQQTNQLRALQKQVAEYEALLGSPEKKKRGRPRKVAAQNGAAEKTE